MRNWTLPKTSFFGKKWRNFSRLEGEFLDHTQFTKIEMKRHSFLSSFPLSVCFTYFVRPWIVQLNNTWFYKGGEYGCFVLINKWFFRRICLTVNPTLLSIWVPRKQTEINTVLIYLLGLGTLENLLNLHNTPTWQRVFWQKEVVILANLVLRKL